MICRFCLEGRVVKHKRDCKCKACQGLEHIECWVCEKCGAVYGGCEE